MSISNAKMIQKIVIPNTVQITVTGNNKKYTATGVFYQNENRTIVITAAHVIQDLIQMLDEEEFADYIELRIPDCESIKINSYKKDWENLSCHECVFYIHERFNTTMKENDVGIIEFHAEADLSGKEKIRMISHMELENADEELFVTGFPLINQNNNIATPLEDTKRIYKDTDAYMEFSYRLPSLVLDRDDFMVGYSGSGVFASYRNDLVLVGIVSRGVGDKDHQMLKEKTTSVKAILELLEKHNFILPKDEIVPDYDEAVKSIKDFIEIDRDYCIENNYRELKNICGGNLNDENCILKSMKNVLGYDLQKEQGIVFCGENEYPCQKYWNNRLLWNLIMRSVVGNRPDDWEKIKLILNGSEVYGQFLCTEENTSDFAFRLVNSYNKDRKPENTIFFSNYEKIDPTNTMYLGKKHLNRIIDNIIRQKTTYLEREKMKNFFDITKPDGRAEWAIVGINELQSKVINSDDEESMRKKIINFLQDEVWC